MAAMQRQRRDGSPEGQVDVGQAAEQPGPIGGVHHGAFFDLWVDSDKLWLRISPADLPKLFTALGP